MARRCDVVYLRYHTGHTKTAELLQHGVVYIGVV